MAYGTLATDTIQSSTAGTPPQFNDGNGTQVGTLCRAWVNFNGASGAIRASFNIGSVTRTGVGRYTVNFTNAMPDANYAITFGTSEGSWVTTAVILTVSTSNFTIFTSNASNYYDVTYANIAIFR